MKGLTGTIRRVAPFAAIAVALLVAQAKDAWAVWARTAHDVTLYAGPGTHYEPLAGIVEGAAVHVHDCGSAWCRAGWKNLVGYVSRGSLQFPNGYQSGYYPDADAYYALPPYADIPPSFFRKRFFMMAQERNRWRYWPHRFNGRYDE